VAEIAKTEVALIGAGPIGLEVAYELKQAGVDYLHLDKAQIGSTIAWFPEQMTFFSSTDRIALAGVPLQTVGQRKCTKEEYLAYLRTFAQAFELKVRTYEEVTSIAGEAGAFLLRTKSAAGEQEIRAARVILATGDMDRAHKLGIDGEDLPHVSHYFRDPHPYFRKRLLIVGGKNSAAEAALRCWHSGVKVAISYRRDAFDKRGVKYWLLPELSGRIRRGEIDCHYETEPVAITPTHVTLRGRGETFEVPADFVLMLVGYEADTRLLEMAGVELSGVERAPRFNEETMETNVPGIYVAGTATAGSQQSYSVFIETCHIHAKRIAAALTGAPPPPEPPPLTQPES
jgi:thioredoxin reductase (NADPH)